jgi:hypothetical protein
MRRRRGPRPIPKYPKPLSHDRVVTGMMDMGRIAVTGMVGIGALGMIGGMLKK